MLETPHVIVGAAIASKIPNPLISIPLAFASHFVLDLVPHWNPHLNTEIKKYGKVTAQSTMFVLVDVIASLAVGSFFALRAAPDTGHVVTIYLTCLASVMPDVIEGPYFFMGIKSKIIDKWISFQKSIQNDTTIIPGLAIQLVTIVACFWWVLGS